MLFESTEEVGRAHLVAVDTYEVVCDCRFVDTNNDTTV